MLLEFFMLRFSYFFMTLQIFKALLFKAGSSFIMNQVHLLPSSSDGFAIFKSLCLLYIIWRIPPPLHEWLDGLSNILPKRGGENENCWNSFNLMKIFLLNPFLTQAYKLYILVKSIITKISKPNQIRTNSS